MAIYEQIISDIIDHIHNGKLKNGDRLPAIRQLSQQYACSKDTIQKALTALAYQRYIYAVNRSGYYVLNDAAHTQHTSREIRHFPVEDFRICLNEAMTQYRSSLFDYGNSPQGLPELVRSLQKHLQERQVFAQEQQIVVTSGSQQALYILMQMAFSHDKRAIAIEQPTYPQMNRLARSLNATVHPITRDAQGLNWQQLEDAARTGGIKFFYTVPRFHNPLGTALREADKQRLIQLAERYQFYIIEDDYMADFEASDIPPLHYYDTTGRVIYLKSFSRILFPALRLGAVVLPEQLITPFIQHKQLIDYETNLLTQQALALYLDSGMFKRHRRRSIARRQDILDRIQQVTQLPLQHTSFCCLLHTPLPDALQQRYAEWLIELTPYYLNDSDLSHLCCFRVDNADFTHCWQAVLPYIKEVIHVI